MLFTNYKDVNFYYLLFSFIFLQGTGIKIKLNDKSKTEINKKKKPGGFICYIFYLNKKNNNKAKQV